MTDRLPARRRRSGAFRSALHHLILPTIVLGTIPLAVIARMTRSSMLEVLGEDYIRTARAKGPQQSARGRICTRCATPDPRRDRDRPAGRHADGRRDPHRDRVLLARHRPAGCSERSAGATIRRCKGGVLLIADSGDVDQSVRRSALRPAQSAHPPPAMKELTMTDVARNRRRTSRDSADFTTARSLAVDARQPGRHGRPDRHRCADHPGAIFADVIAPAQSDRAVPRASSSSPPVWVEGGLLGLSARHRRSSAATCSRASSTARGISLFIGVIVVTMSLGARHCSSA